MMVQERCSYIKKSTTPMSRPTRPQMISPSPTCTRRLMTPRTGDRHRQWRAGARGWEETWRGITGHQQQVQGGVSGPLVVIVWRPADTSPRMLPEPTIAKSQVKGYTTFASLFLQFTADAGYNAHRVKLTPHAEAAWSMRPSWVFLVWSSLFSSELKELI